MYRARYAKPSCTVTHKYHLMTETEQRKFASDTRNNTVRVFCVCVCVCVWPVLVRVRRRGSRWVVGCIGRRKLENRQRKDRCRRIWGRCKWRWSQRLPWDIWFCTSTMILSLCRVLTRSEVVYFLVSRLGFLLDSPPPSTTPAIWWIFFSLVLWVFSWGLCHICQAHTQWWKIYVCFFPFPFSVIFFLTVTFQH